jgi:serine protease Do
VTRRTASPRPWAVAWAAIVCAGIAGCRERAPDATGPGEPPGAASPARALPGAPVAPAPPARPRILYPSAPGSFVDLVAGARHGVVAIRAGAPIKSGPAAMFPGAPEATADVALGTGFLIERSEMGGGDSDGSAGGSAGGTGRTAPRGIDAHGAFVLTNDHIAAAAPELRVVLADRSEVPARLVGRDTRLDLALLSVDASHATPPPLALGNSDELQVGEWLVVLGDPFGDEVSAAVGVVSATGRDAGSLVAGGALGLRTFIQTDARIHRGNSGGPVLDTAGQVVGVAVATGDRPGELSFAIPIDRFKEVVDAMRDAGQVARSWLGARVQPVDAERAQAAGLPGPSGALVTEVRAGSPAATAGLRVGDILLSWGDRQADPRSLPGIVSQAPAGRAVHVAIWRDRARVDATVVPQKMPE